MPSRQTPTRNVSVNAAPSMASGSAVVSSGSPAMVLATRTAIVEVVETLSARAPPSTAYTIIGAMQV